MNSDLQKQQQAFMRAMREQPKIERHFVNRPAIPNNETSTTTSRVTSVINDASLAEVLGNRPINSYIHIIIMDLKSAARPLSIHEIKERLGIDLLVHPEFLERVCLSERIEFDPSSSTLRYSPPYGIRSKTDILPALLRQPNRRGIEVSEIKDAFPRIDDAILELKERGDIYELRHKDDGPRIIFANDHNLKATEGKVSADAGLKSLWNEASVPSESFEIKSQLIKAGLKPANVIDPDGVILSYSDASGSSGITGPSARGRGASRRQNTARKPFRRIKITNDYLEGIDLSVDPAAKSDTQ